MMNIILKDDEHDDEYDGAGTSGMSFMCKG